jgi:hypothetical protein
MRLDEIREVAALMLYKSAIACCGIGAFLCLERIAGGWFDWQELGVWPNPLAFMESGIICMSAALIVSPD